MMLLDKAPQADSRIRNAGAGKRLFRFAGAVFGILLLGGCSILSGLSLLPTSPNPSPSNTEPPQSSPTQAVTAPSTTSTLQSEQNNLIVWVPPQFDPKSDSESGRLLQERLDEFINVHPGLTIEVRVKAESGQGGLLDSLSTTSAAAPSAIPSLVALGRLDMETAVLKGLILPWDGLIGTDFTQQLYPYASDLGSIQKMTYGLVFAGDALVMIYRPLQVGYAPESWNEYTSRGYPVIFPAGDPQALVATQMLLSLDTGEAASDGKTVVNQEDLKKSYLAINQGVTNQVFPYWLADYDTFDKGYQAFLDIKANYAVVWASSVINHLPENTELAPLPGVNAGSFTLANGWMWVLPNASEEKRQLIVALAEYLTDPQFLAQWTEAADVLPASKNILTQWQNQTGISVLDEIATSARIIPSNEYLSSISPILQEGVLGMVRGQINYLQALDNSIKDLQLIAPPSGG